MPDEEVGVVVVVVFPFCDMEAGTPKLLLELPSMFFELLMVSLRSHSEIELVPSLTDSDLRRYAC